MVRIAVSLIAEKNVPD